jgi:hypothetical protein
MKPSTEAARGIEYLREIFESSKILKLGDPSDLIGNGFAFHFDVRAYGKQWDFSVSREQLSDLPSMPKYRQSASDLARILEKRFQNVSPDIFLTASWQPIQIEVFWPIRALPGRFASYVETHITKTRTQEFARCYVVITYQDNIGQLKEVPFQIHEGITNSVRNAADFDQIKFYPSRTEHPDDIQPISLSFVAKAPGVVDVGDFLKQKVNLLGFRAVSKDTRVWIADPWDSAYINAQPKILLQEAEILEAEEYIRLDDSRQFATADKKLLLDAKFKTQMNLSRQSPSRGESAQDKFDVFLSHASNDKEFVRNLATALGRRGISYWLDEIQLTVGDSLRRVIDAGLASSRFGVVVLSKHFFAKEWPQRELDGLLAMEIERKVILPVWHQITEGEVRSFSPTLAGRLAAKTTDGVDVVADKIVRAIAKS